MCCHFEPLGKRRRLYIGQTLFTEREQGQSLLDMWGTAWGLHIYPCLQSLSLHFT